MGWALNEPSSHPKTWDPLRFKLRTRHAIMNLSLYSVNAFVVLDSEGHRVLAKYYRPKGNAQDSLTPKDQRTFEKGLWQKTKKPGGV